MSDPCLQTSTCSNIRSGILQFTPEIQEGKGYFPSEEVYWHIEAPHAPPCHCRSCRYAGWCRKGGQRQPPAPCLSAVAPVHQTPSPQAEGSQAPSTPMAEVTCPAGHPSFTFQPSASALFRGTGGRDQWFQLPAPLRSPASPRVQEMPVPLPASEPQSNLQRIACSDPVDVQLPADTWKTQMTWEISFSPDSHGGKTP